MVGYEGSAKRIDTAAAALWNRMTVEEMTALDLAYAPPFAPVWDPILVAARQAAGAGRQAGTSYVRRDRWAPRRCQPIDLRFTAIGARALSPLQHTLAPYVHILRGTRTLS